MDATEQSADVGDLPADRPTRAGPYWVYGAQQDNSTIAVPSVGSDTPYAVGGGESGHIAVDPRDYNIVYAGNYGGTLSRIDRKFNISENIRVYADSQTGQRAADMKYPLPVERADQDLAAQPRRRLHDVAGRAPHDERRARLDGRSVRT